MLVVAFDQKFRAEIRAELRAARNFCERICPGSRWKACGELKSGRAPIGHSQGQFGCKLGFPVVALDQKFRAEMRAEIRAARNFCERARSVCPGSRWGLSNEASVQSV